MKCTVTRCSIMCNKTSYNFLCKNVMDYIYWVRHSLTQSDSHSYFLPLALCRWIDNGDDWLDQKRYLTEWLTDTDRFYCGTRACMRSHLFSHCLCHSKVVRSQELLTYKHTYFVYFQRFHTTLYTSTLSFGYYYYHDCRMYWRSISKHTSYIHESLVQW